jgi:sn-glycerol 3-phosphate transport system ATP-binding protein
MGRAIVREPSVFLFDEPLSNLDAKLRTQLRAELKDLHQRLGATFVFVTHDQVEAMSLADRIVIMSEGRIEQIGTPMELYGNPASVFVAEFIGAPPMNVFPLTSDAGRAFAQMSPEMPDAASMVGVRPEALEIASDGPRAKVGLIEALGAETLVHLRIGSDNLILRTGHINGLTEGMEIGLSHSSSGMTFFDESKRAIWVSNA